ncbi:molybdopterin molybdotransferase [Bathymodiolus platifrons methanotrophic gill symbiont]|uniref:molybdopterin-guanine dinucleotide biosynthesis protein B n=1 Tax=Bathymodiolus platifrons methanotrophic gill symbiont TaxID=113268 RepID=UPI000B40A6E4|nr:molybdopterin-guanine dinucleotide biosynthesis protein B [Bathymodiolus platifrons methanotrophic gill symbiont]MCK5870617.1 molybdopterin-guanine dinucleotide biosynthesis protein B [Methyloprofundus sp.]TXK93899.1 molybdopterin-guanine dinucleotide biosynthesis protein B [Methylococcaceae bacterium CS4]TXK94629.1 molybdopterin-guanine dinucleotide biosynthesis protein B [Methylococcaceae bacterium CS5]TXK94665.1 molybdopterin-guanine dinucleotide biosynthesis protein B [Methylococcaceae b
MKHALIPILGLAAPSGTGKTTLLTQLIPQLKQHDIRVGLIKHSHHNFQIDKPGKDSFRLREAGATPVMLVSSHRRAIITEFATPEEPSLNEQLKYFDQSSLDLILVEGFKSETFPKIELHRPSLELAQLYPDDSSIIAIATDHEISIKREIITLDLNNIPQIADFILRTFLKKHD